MTKYAHLSAAELLNQVQYLPSGEAYAELCRRVERLAEIDDIISNIGSYIPEVDPREIHDVEGLIAYTVDIVNKYY